MIYNIGTDEIFNVTRPSIERYCEKYDLELIIKTKLPKKAIHPKYALFGDDVYLWSQDIPRLLIMDSDILIRNHAPNIFDSDADYFHGWNEGEVHLRDPEWKLKFEVEMRRQARKYFSNLNDLKYPEYHINGGIQLSSPHHRIIYEMPPWDPTEKNHLWLKWKIVKNQPWLNFQLARYNIDVQCLDRKWNYLNPIHRNNIANADNAYFWHLTGNNFGRLHEKRRMHHIITRRHPPKNEKRTCMFTAAIGDKYEALCDLTSPYMYDWASRCGYDFKIFSTYDDDKYPHPAWSKIQHTYDLLKKYEQVLYVDVDIVINTHHVVDLFSGLQEDEYSVFDSYPEMPYMRRSSEINMIKYLNKRDHTKLTILPDRLKTHYFNTGVYLVSRSMIDIFNFSKSEIFEPDKMWEQTPLTVKLLESPFKLKPLPRKYNYSHLNRIRDIKPIVRDNAFLHLNGFSRKDRESWAKKIIQMIYTRRPK